MQNDPRQQNPADQRDAELIARLLSAGSKAGPSEAPLDAADQLRLESWESLLGECRAELQNVAELDQVRELRVRRRILAASTREDLSLRADWGLVRGFLAQRLRSSLPLRVVAASLLLHMVALPVMAYYTWVQPPPEPYIHINLSENNQDLPFEDVLPEPLSEPQSGRWPELDSLEATDPRDWLPEHLKSDVSLRLAAPESVLWKDELGLALLAEVLVGERLSASPADSVADRRRLDFVLDQMRVALESLQSRSNCLALRRFVASSWLRVRAAGLGDPSVELERECIFWLGNSKSLEGSNWLKAYKAAADELAGQ